MAHAELVKAPSIESPIEVITQYNRGTRAARAIAHFIQGHGYSARPHGGPAAGPMLLIPAAIEAFIRISEGTPWAEAGIPGLPMRVSHDIRSYYETAALAMVDHAPAAWASTRWFLDQTETGKVMMAARQAMQDQDAPQPMWFYLIPGDR